MPCRCRFRKPRTRRGRRCRAGGRRPDVEHQPRRPPARTVGGVFDHDRVVVGVEVTLGSRSEYTYPVSGSCGEPWTNSSRRAPSVTSRDTGHPRSPRVERAQGRGAPHRDGRHPHAPARRHRRAASPRHRPAGRPPLTLRQAQASGRVRQVADGIAEEVHAVRAHGLELGQARSQRHAVSVHVGEQPDPHVPEPRPRHRGCRRRRHPRVHPIAPRPTGGRTRPDVPPADPASRPPSRGPGQAPQTATFSSSRRMVTVSRRRR